MKAKMINVLAAMKRAMENMVERDREQLATLSLYLQGATPMSYKEVFYYGI